VVAVAAFRFLDGIVVGGFCQESFICAERRSDSPQLESTSSHETVNIERNNHPLTQHITIKNTHRSKYTPNEIQKKQRIKKHNPTP